jgi:hypothetical protein
MKKGYFNNNICIVVQGPIDYIENIVETYEKFKNNVIISTNQIQPHNLQYLYDKGFKVIINELSVNPGRANFNNQVKNTYEGIKMANKLGFNYVFKIRSDIFIDDLSELINSLNQNTVYFSAYHNYDGGYLCEHMLFGSAEFMLKLWDIPVSNSTLPPETQLTKKYDEISDGCKIDFLFPILYNHNIKAYWSKYGMFLNEYKNDKLFSYEKK